MIAGGPDVRVHSGPCFLDKKGSIFSNSSLWHLIPDYTLLYYLISEFFQEGGCKNKVDEFLIF